MTGPAAFSWQPIETAPKETEILLGAFYNSGHWDMQIGCWSIRRKWPYVGQNLPTHWMPLPPPPQSPAVPE